MVINLPTAKQLADELYNNCDCQLLQSSVLPDPLHYNEEDKSIIRLHFTGIVSHLKVLQDVVRRVNEEASHHTVKAGRHLWPGIHLLWMGTSTSGMPAAVQ
jgi:hypothetical protein